MSLPLAVSSSIIPSADNCSRTVQKPAIALALRESYPTLFLRKNQAFSSGIAECG
jgi:hypothetical protein